MPQSARQLVLVALEDSLPKAAMGFVTLVGGMVLVLAFAVAQHAADPVVARARLSAIVPLILLFGVAIAVVIAIVTFFQRRGLRQDLRTGEIVRAIGPLRAVMDGGGEDPVTFYLKLGRRELPSPWGRSDPPFTELSDARVDHTPHAGLVFEIRDRNGREVYRRPGYRADVPPESAVDSA